MSATGVYNILPTPFTEEGDIDETSLRNLIDFQIEAGLHGLAILGFMGEAQKLTDNERVQVIATVLDQAQGKIPTWVGVQALGTRAAIEQARQAERLGASAVFVAPINVQDDEVICAFYRQVAESIAIPIVIHDYPDSFKTILSPALIARLTQEIPGVQYIKLEDPPVGPKITKVRELTQDKIKIFGGLGGAYFLEELQRGAVGIMTGLAFPEILVRIYNKFQQGDMLGAAETFDHYIPLIRYEAQPKIGLAFRKYIYYRRGIIATTTVRHPGPKLDDYTARELEQIIQRVGLSLEKLGVQEIV